MKRLTIKFVREELKKIGFTIRKDSSGDFVVRRKGSGEDGYHTDDLQDAYDTARLRATLNM